MANSFASVLAKFNSLIDWFMPASAAHDRELAKHMRMYLISHILGPFLGNSVPLALYVFDPNPGINIAVLAAAITSFWIFPFILRAYRHLYYTLAVISLENLMFCILWSCYFYGGITSPTLPWVLVIPLHVIFYVGSAPVLRLVMLGMFTANFALFYVLSVWHGLPAHNMPFSSLQGLGLISTAAASMYTAMMAFFYAKILASHGEIEREVREHLATATALRQATEEAERAGAAKADFLAKMSHELRTPLNAVIGYSQILLEDVEEDDDQATVEDLQKIHQAGKHLLKLVNEVLDLIKIDAGKMELYSEPVSIKEVVEDVVSELAGHAELGRVNVTAEFEGDLSGLQTDRLRLHDAIYEITENAIKFSRGGSVRIAANRLKSHFGHGEDGLEIAISDTGVGIPEEHLAGIFEQFNVLNDSSSSKYGSTGLGLALTKRICHLLGGDIFVQSVAQNGSTFTIIVPFVVDITEKPTSESEPLNIDETARQLALAEEAVGQLKDALQMNASKFGKGEKAASNG